jgi:hypothetical protein
MQEIPRRQADLEKNRKSLSTGDELEKGLPVFMLLRFTNFICYGFIIFAKTFTRHSALHKDCY